MALLNNNIVVTVTANAPAIDGASLDVPLFLTAPGDLNPVNFTTRTRTYTSAAEVAADADLDATTKAAVSTAFAQSQPRVGSIKVGRVDTADGADDAERYTAALNAIRAADDAWYFLAAKTRTDADLVTIATWAESNAKIYIAQSEAANNLDGSTGPVDTLSGASRTRTALLHHAANEWADVAWVAKKGGANPDVQTTTWAYATLSGVTPSQLTSTQRSALEAANGNLYGTFFGQGATWPGTTANGDKIDKRITLDWTERRVQERIAQLFATVSNRNTKLSYDDAGLQALGAAVQEVLSRGVAAGHFVEGTIGVNVPRRAQVSPTDVQNRIARISFTAQIAGAIEQAVISGAVLIELPA